MIAFLLPHGMEIWVILLVALLLFGHRIPGAARALGSGIVEFKRGLRGDPDSGSGKDQLPSGAGSTPDENLKSDS